MYEYRKLPGFYGKEGPRIGYLVGTIPLLPALFFFYIAFSNPRRDLSEWGGFLMAILGGASFVCLALFCFLQAASNKVPSEKKTWLTDAVWEQTVILGREVIENEYAAIYDVQPTEWHLKLQPTPRQSASLPGVNLIMVNIRKSQYQSYENRKTVALFSSPSEPLVFLLEDEV